MLVTLEGITISDRESQSINAISPMLVTLEGMTIFDRELHLLNASLPMLVTLEGMTYDSIFWFLKEIILFLSLLNKISSSLIKFGDKHCNLPFQSANGLPFKPITLLGMDIYFNEVQLENALSPILVTLDGMTISDRERQPENALSPILVTLEGMTISDRELQPENALSPMLVTLEGMTYDYTFWFLKEIILLLSLLNKISSS